MGWKPVRKIRPTRGMNYRSKIPSTKNVNIIHTESLLERDYVLICSINPRIRKIHFQAVPVGYQYKGRNHVYFPDFLLELEDGSYVLVEVKLLQFVDTNLNKVKYHAGHIYCSGKKGWRFQVVTEQEIRKGQLLNNINLLQSYREFPLTPAISEYITTRLRINSSCSIGQLRKECEEVVESSLFTINLYKLIQMHKIRIDLIHQKISESTLIGAVREG